MRRIRRLPFRAATNTDTNNIPIPIPSPLPIPIIYKIPIPIIYGLDWALAPALAQRLARAGAPKMQPRRWARARAQSNPYIIGILLVFGIGIGTCY